MARNKAGATGKINFGEDADVGEQLKELTGGRGPDAVIDAVGMEATHGHGALHAYDRVKQATRAESDRGHALRDAILACRPGGIVSVIGVYGGKTDPLPMMSLFDKQVQLRMGQANVRRWVDDIMPLLTRDNDPLGVDDFATHRIPLSQAPQAYATFQAKEDGMVKVLLRP